MDRIESELREMLVDRRLTRWPNEEEWKAIWVAANAPGYQGTLSAAIHASAPELLHPDWAELRNIEPAEAKMMWTEICVRTSISPFVAENVPFTERQKSETVFQSKYKELTSRGWRVVSNGPDGMELQAPRRFKIIDYILLVIGVASLVFYGVGLLFIGAALFDYFVLSTRERVTLPRPPQ
ncbi:MAG: hypothetical protein JSR48_15465 [Verrucomicrobia bacterium]|nr:hypothetical protein [Verrucomicrobiota bacterium]